MNLPPPDPPENSKPSLPPPTEPPPTEPPPPSPAAPSAPPAQPAPKTEPAHTAKSKATEPSTTQSEDPGDDAADDSWAGLVQDAIQFPLRGDGSAILATGAVLSLVIGLGGMVPIAGVLIVLLGSAYFASYSLRIVQTGITGRDTPPDWPDFSNAWENVALPAIQVFLVSLIGLVPAMLLMFLTGADPEGGLSLGKLLGVLYALLYMPMAVAGLAVTGSVSGALPHLVWPAITRCMPEYWPAFLILITAWLGEQVVSGILGRVIFLGPLILAVFSLFLLVVTSRFTATLYRKFKDRIKW
jgi:hypothetical protein